ncbi:hypothetical protein J1N35_007738, partial [Gossypium stocksii]
ISQLKLDTLVKGHMVTLMGYFAETIDNEDNLDENTQKDMVFKSLSKDFAGFQATYNLRNKKLTLTVNSKLYRFFIDVYVTFLLRIYVDPYV